MKFIDPHIHMYSRTTDDYEKMKLSGIQIIIEPSFWLGQDRTSANTLKDYWDHIINFENKRALEHGIKHYCAIAVNPRDANNRNIVHDALPILQAYLQKENVVAMGEVGFDLINKDEEDVLSKQLLLADELKIPIIIHTPHINKLEGTKKIFNLIEKLGIEQSRIIIDHNNEETIELSLSHDVISGITVYPETKLSPIRTINILKKYGLERIIINSSADWGKSDPLSVPKTALQMEKEGFSESEIEKLLFSNPNNFFRQSKNYKD